MFKAFIITLFEALRVVQKRNPSYNHSDGVQGWWGDVIQQTALGCGVDPEGKSDTGSVLKLLKGQV